MPTKSGKLGKRPAEPHLLRAVFIWAGTFHAATLSPGAASHKEKLFLVLMFLPPEAFPS